MTDDEILAILQCQLQSYVHHKLGTGQLFETRQRASQRLLDTCETHLSGLLADFRHIKADNARLQNQVWQMGLALEFAVQARRR